MHQAGRIHNLHQVCGNSVCLGNVVKLTGQIEFIIHCGTMYHSKQSAMLGGNSNPSSTLVLRPVKNCNFSRNYSNVVLLVGSFFVR